MTNYEYLIELENEEKRVNFIENEFHRNQDTMLVAEILSEFYRWLGKPYHKTITLTDEETQAVILAIEIGFPWIRRRQNDESVLVYDKPDGYLMSNVLNIPALRILAGAEWIEYGVCDLRKLL
jgi:effector-binding domain-containing protein